MVTMAATFLAGGELVGSAACAARSAKANAHAMLISAASLQRTRFTFLQLSFAPGFCPVIRVAEGKAVSTACLAPKARKPLKRFSFTSLKHTRLKPCANERFPRVSKKFRSTRLQGQQPARTVPGNCSNLISVVQFDLDDSIRATPYTKNSGTRNRRRVPTCSNSNP